MPITLGGDVSKFQGDINYDVYVNNSQFIITKASEGNGFKDPKLDRNKAEARRVGLILGYYHFARPDLNNSPETEADWFLKAIGDFREGEFLCLDYEANWNGNVVGWCKLFLDRLATRLNGYRPLIYINQSVATSYNWQSVVDAGYGLWIAAYSFDPNINNFQIGAWPFAAMQQWTDRQQVPGIPALSDGNVFFGDLETLRRYCYYLTPPPPPTPPIPTPDPTPPVPPPPPPPPPQPTPVPEVPPKPVPTPTETPGIPPKNPPESPADTESPPNYYPLLKQIRIILYGKGFWWTKLAKIRILLPQTS